MAKTWFTSDMHFGHENIIKYCNRPFKSLDDMNTKLINNWNERVKPEDIVYHVGDFCFHSGREGGKVKAKVWESKLNGSIYHVYGNHDSNNGVKSILLSGILVIDKQLVFVTHKPPKSRLDIPDGCKYVLCGHVHEKWDYNYTIEQNPLLMINVGTDANKFRPIGLDEIINKVRKLNPS